MELSSVGKARPVHRRLRKPMFQGVSVDFGVDTHADGVDGVCLGGKCMRDKLCAFSTSSMIATLWRADGGYTSCGALNRHIHSR